MACENMKEMIRRTKALEVPVTGDATINVVMGILNCFFFGIGMIVLGAMNSDCVDILIGIHQLVGVVIGWIWAIVWGILIVVRNLPRMPK